jgi:MFS family permease
MSISIPARPRLYTRPFILMALANLFTVSSISAFFLFPLFLAQAGADKADIGLLMGAMALSSVLCRPYISQFIDRIGRKRGYLFGCLIMAGLPFSYLLFQGNVTEFYIPLILVRLLHGVGAALCFTSAFTYIADVVPEARLNEGVGMFGTTGLMAMALGPAVGEAVIRYFGFPAFFTTGAAFGGLGLILSLPLKESLVKNTSGSKATFFSVLWRPRIRTVGLLALLFGVGLAAYGSFVSPFAQALNIQMVSLYFIAYSFTAVLTRIFGGRLADRMGELRIVPYALSITGGGLGLVDFPERTGAPDPVRADYRHRTRIPFSMPERSGPARRAHGNSRQNKRRLYGWNRRRRLCRFPGFGIYWENVRISGDIRRRRIGIAGRFANITKTA